MGKQGVIVRRLDAIENLGSMTVLCTDKTGTLTEGTIVLADADGSETGARRPPSGSSPSSTRRSRPASTTRSTRRSSTAGEQAGLSADGHAKIDEIPYDFLQEAPDDRDGRGRRRRAASRRHEGRVRERALDLHAGRARTAPCALTDAATAELSAYYEAKGKAGLPRARARDACRRRPRRPIGATTRRRWSSPASCSSSTRPRPTRRACSATSPS